MRCMAVSHNIMDGHHAFRLFPYYKSLINRARETGSPVGFCCIQEDVAAVFGKNTVFLSHLLAAFLGPNFSTIKSKTEPRLATIYNRDLFRINSQPTVVNLPKLEKLPAWKYYLDFCTSRIGID